MPKTASALTTLGRALARTWFSNLVARFDLPDGKVLSLQVINQGGLIHEFQGAESTQKPDPKSTGIAAILREVAARYPKAVLRVDELSVVVKAPASVKIPTKTEVKKLFVQAWHEDLGRSIPSDQDLANRRKASKAAKASSANDAVALLRSGPKGVQEFNGRPREQQQSFDLRKADLSNCDLSGLKVTGLRLDGADLSGSNLSGATVRSRASLTGAKLVGCNLTGADLCLCKCMSADFSRAIARNANLSSANLGRADFSGADLTGADLSSAILKGANLSGAILQGCKLAYTRFDENTKWPKGFTPPPDMTFTGKGPDPRFAPTKREKKRPPPTDFAGFLARLQKATDPAKLKKAMAMLKAERFRLFAQVADDYLVGVVKSQSEPDRVYSCRLARDGTYGCCTQNLNVCGGLKGSPCKHLLVLVVGLTQAGELDPATAHARTQAARGVKPVLDKDAMTETLLRYKGAEAGEIDWRPTETIPEDFYAT